MHRQDPARDLRRQRAVMRRPRDVIERDELHHQHAVMRGFGDGEMEVAAGPRVGVAIIDQAFGFGQQSPQPRVVGRASRARRRVRPPSVSIARWASITSAAVTPVRSSCTASASANSRGLPRATRAPPPFAHADFGDAERLQRAQRVTRHDPADAVAGGKVLLGADRITRISAASRSAHRAHPRRSAPTASRSGRPRTARRIATMSLACVFTAVFSLSVPRRP
jgi:hypothetical protein